MRWKTIVAASVATLTVCVGPGLAATVHPELAARLSGMGEHGIVNLTVKPHDVCWRFVLPSTHATAASIRDAHGMTVARLGTHYGAKGCAMISPRAIALVDASPSKYQVWVDTKAHVGELRGKLFVGMAHM
jgi:hypothetical protein